MYPVYELVLAAVIQVSSSQPQVMELKMLKIFKKMNFSKEKAV